MRFLLGLFIGLVVGFVAAFLAVSKLVGKSVGLTLKETGLVEHLRPHGWLENLDSGMAKR